MFEIKVSNSYEAEKVLHSEFIWARAVDDFILEVFQKDSLDALDLLADYNLLDYS